MKQDENSEDQIIHNSKALAGEIQALIHERTRDRDDVDYGMVLFSLFVSAVHVLKECGCSKSELVKEVETHWEL